MKNKYRKETQNLTSFLLEEICLKYNKSLTPTRLLIYRIIEKNNRPISAYEIQEEVRNSDLNFNISTVYRVLDFFIDIGLIHKLATINKFTICAKPKEKHIHMINLCTRCENVVESCNKVMGLDFKKSMSNFDMLINQKHTIELSVLCSGCK